jgi:hypothetical protein
MDHLEGIRVCAVLLVREQCDELHHKQLSDSLFQREGLQSRIDPALRQSGGETGGEQKAGEEESAEVLHVGRISNDGKRWTVVMLREVVQIIIVESKNM